MLLLVKNTVTIVIKCDKFVIFDRYVLYFKNTQIMGLSSIMDDCLKSCNKQKTY